MERLSIIFKSVFNIGDSLTKLMVPFMDGIKEAELPKNLKNRGARFSTKFKNRLISPYNKTMRRVNAARNISKSVLKKRGGKLNHYTRKKLYTNKK